MKKIISAIVLTALTFCIISCDPDPVDPIDPDTTYDYMSFVGTWGVKQIDYYNIDYYGQPIEASRVVYRFTPGDTENGIDLVFRDDRTGKMVDRSRDTIILSNDSYIVCPDTVLVTEFTYSYHKDDAILYMNMKVNKPFTYMMRIPSITSESFTYINEYDINYVEEACLVKIDDKTKGVNPTRNSQPTFRPRRKGSLLSDR